ncbi:beta-lactamase/transpeptidase-like protein [Tirmania nivea]|nr:beta-lactamase/transpeptidase-like protein [Tirmania nivea]
MSDPIHLHLPDFTLPPPFTHELITLNMLGGHTSGLARDISVCGVNFSDDSGPGVLEYMSWNNYYHQNYSKAQGNQKVLSFDFETTGKRYMERGRNGNEGDGMARISAPGKCRLTREGDEDKEWHMCTKEELFKLVRGTRLIWLPGEMVSCRWDQESYLLKNLLNRDVFQTLGMNSSFFHPIPEHLKSKMTIPRSGHMVDLDFGEAYDPAGGMYSTASDLNNFLLSILSAEPTILNPITLRNWFKPSFALPNGLSSVGIPWEIESRQYPSSALAPGPVYQLYGKGGALPGHYSHISFIPELGYGVVALVATGSEQSDIGRGAVKESNPDLLSNIVHDELVALLREAYASYLKEIYAGTYIQYSPSPSVASTSKSAQGKAIISFDSNRFLVLDSLVTSSNISLLAYLDSLNPSSSGTYAPGGKLWPSGVEGEFRIRGGKAPETRDGKRGCREWFGFDEATSEDGWGVDKIVIRKYEDDTPEGAYSHDGTSESDVSSERWELVYEPLEVVFRKSDL